MYIVQQVERQKKTGRERKIERGKRKINKKEKRKRERQRERERDRGKE